MALDIIETVAFDSANVGPKVTEFSQKQAELMPIEFNQYVNVKQTLAADKPRLKKPNMKTSADLLADLKERESRLSQLKLKEQNIHCKRNILATQIHLKNIQIGQDSPDIIKTIIAKMNPEAQDAGDVEMTQNKESQLVQEKSIVSH